MILEAHIAVEQIVGHFYASPANFPIIDKILQKGLGARHKDSIGCKVGHIARKSVIFDQKERVGIRDIDWLKVGRVTIFLKIWRMNMNCTPSRTNVILKGIIEEENRSGRCLDKHWRYRLVREGHRIIFENFIWLKELTEQELVFVGGRLTPIKHEQFVAASVLRIFECSWREELCDARRVPIHEYILDVGHISHKRTILHLHSSIETLQI